MCGIVAMCYLASEASQNPEQKIHSATELTQDTADLPNAQNSVLEIIAAIGKLLVKLMAEETFWNGTVAQAKGQMATTLTQFLNIESVYRLAQATEESSIQTATYTLEKVEQLRAQKELQEKVVQQKSAEFPIEKKAINSDRELILTLIKMVESIGADNHNVTTSTKANPAAAKAELQNLQSDLRLFQTIGAHLAANGGGGSHVLTSALRQLASLERRGKGMLLDAPTEDEMRETQNEVKAVLLTLLQDPAFREYLLESGMADAVQDLIVINDKIATKEASRFPPCLLSNMSSAPPHLPPSGACHHAFALGPPDPYARPKSDPARRARPGSVCVCRAMSPTGSAVGNLSVSLSLCLSLSVSLCLALVYSVSLSLCLPVSLSVCLSVSVSLCLSLSLTLSLPLSPFLSLSVSVPVSFIPPFLCFSAGAELA